MKSEIQAPDRAVARDESRPARSVRDSPEAWIAVGGSLLAATLFLTLGPALATMGALSVALVGLSLANPGAYLLATVLVYSALQGFLAGLRLGDVLPISVNASQAMMTFFTSWWICRMLIALARRESIPLPSAAIRLHFAFVAWAILSAPLQPHEGQVPAIARLLACLVIHYVGYWLGSERRWAGFVPTAVGFAAIAAGMSAGVEALTVKRVAEEISYGAFRAAGSFTGPVTTATVAMVGLPVFSMWILPGSGRRLRLFAAIGFIAIAAAIAATLTRTALVGVVLYGFLLVMMGRRGLTSRGRLQRILVAVVPVLLVMLLLLAVPDKYIRSRSEDLPGQVPGVGFSAESGSGRGLLWRGMVTIQMQSSVPEWVIGHGVESVLRDLPVVTGLLAGGHNSYMEVLYQTGLVGLVIFGGLLTANIRMLQSSRASAGPHDRERMFWRAYYIAFLLSTIMFNGFIWDVGSNWLTYLGLGYAQALPRTVEQATSRVSR